ncbi:PemK-like protein [mine drainage metagenome]|uniref:PemK-like protein n=1 Tax=mine drainage metagenome TaxID=410659 RepID=A0A1J5RPM1_9ZZZZ
MTRSAKPRFQPWDVVLVPFPYTERNYTKVRPALIVSTDTLSSKTGKYFLAMITSAQHTRVYGDVLISDLKLAGLPADSIVRPSKIATFEEASFVRRTGTLVVKDRDGVSAQLREILCVGEKD